MADILKVSTPLVDKLPQQSLRPVADPSLPFNLSDVTRVKQTTDTSALLQQNTGLAENRAETPKILAELLSDPAVTAAMIGGISQLQEIIGLMPANNTALTQEIEQLFAQLLMRPQDIVAELMRQEQSTTLFKGDLFDQLRALVDQNPGRSDLATGVGVLLKALNAAVSRPDVLESVANNLTFLAGSVNSSAQLSGTLLQLAEALRQPDAGQNFGALKQQIFEALGQLQGSVLFSPQMEKVLPLVVYNLSRYNDNPDFLPDALALLLSHIDGEGQRMALVNNLQAFLDKVLLGSPADGVLGQNTVGGQAAAGQAPPPPEGESPAPRALPDTDAATGDGQPGARGAAPSALAAQNLAQRLEAYYSQSNSGELFALGAGPTHSPRGVPEESQVIETLAKIIGKQARSEAVQLLSGDKVNRVIESLLSSPSNFTPLLHFIVPVEFEDLRAFAEIWVDPNAGEDEPARRGQAGDATHMLLVFDVEGLGRFESELYVQNKRIALNLLCPPAYMEEFRRIGPAIRQAVAATGYSFESIHIDRLERTHSLMDVFTDLPYKRTGIDVKI